MICLTERPTAAGYGGTSYYERSTGVQGNITKLRREVPAAGRSGRTFLGSLYSESNSLPA